MGHSIAYSAQKKNANTKNDEKIGSFLTRTAKTEKSENKFRIIITTMYTSYKNVIAVSITSIHNTGIFRHF